MSKFLAVTGAIAAVIAGAFVAGGGDRGFVPVPLPVAPREAQPSQLDLPPAPAPSVCKGQVALSFDDGPTPLTSQLLAVLDHYDVPATFFNVGSQSLKDPRQVDLTRLAGHEIGNHTMTHPDLRQLSRTHLQREISGIAVVHRSLGLTQTAPLFRPPYGATSPQIRALVEERGLTEVLWDRDSKDWEATTAEAIVERSQGMRDGDILLLHDGRPLTIQALPVIIRHYHHQGLCFGRIAASDEERPAPEHGTTHRAVAVSK